VKRFVNALFLQKYLATRRDVQVTAPTGARRADSELAIVGDNQSNHIPLFIALTTSQTGSFWLMLSL